MLPMAACVAVSRCFPTSQHTTAMSFTTCPSAGPVFDSHRLQEPSGPLFPRVLKARSETKLVVCVTNIVELDRLPFLSVQSSNYASICMKYVMKRPAPGRKRKPVTGLLKLAWTYAFCIFACYELHTSASSLSSSSYLPTQYCTSMAAAPIKLLTHSFVTMSECSSGPLWRHRPTFGNN